MGAIAAVIGAVGMIAAAFITVWGQDGGGERQSPGTIVQTNERGDNQVCVGQRVQCGAGATSSAPGTDRPAPRGSSGG
ncbi:hypothetical protein [Streptomyces spectabilis]|uniref:Uncharacterized protein n=1 Tax=Streptomyces spectabilis TaxID=68270 RepID=A0A7W8APV2_STRST|nr:hypothetical protein [Streptomyces spectabilis]MBB5102348.1 hypothetical protein [Streptomyces spectabilis]MCI3907395.1 hypothetical protein [Streptomyces spectabilis]